MNAEKVRYEKMIDDYKPSLSNRIIRYFPDTHLGNGHQGLSDIAMAKKINVTKLQPGEFVIFVNKSQTGLKMFAPGNVVAYLKMPSGKISPKVIAHIPRFFNGSEINYSAALEKVIKKEFSNGARNKGVARMAI